MRVCGAPQHGICEERALYENVSQGALLLGHFFRNLTLKYVRFELAEDNSFSSCIVSRYARYSVSADK